MITETLGDVGIGTAVSAKPNTFIVNDRGLEYIEGGRVLDKNSYDWTNADGSSVVRSGTIVGKITATGKYAPTILGILTANASSGATTLNIGSAGATALVARVGSSGTGTLSVVGPPAAAGTVAQQTLTYTAVNASTGDITVSATSAAYALGSIIVAADGSQNPVGFLQDTHYGTNVLTPSGVRVDAQIARLIVAGHIKTLRVPAFSTLEASTLAYLKAKLNSNGRHFIFDDEY